MGNLDEAEDFYRKARDLTHKDECEDALRRLASRKKEVEELTWMGIVLAKHTFE